MIAALFVQRNGCYWDLPGVDPWDVERDARTYAGPHAVVAHPPCQRWGRYWSGGPSARVRRKKGDDGGCFAAALAAVKRWGGVLEHPEASHAWRAFDIVAPPKSGGWIPAGLHHPGAWTCCVEQGHYGHPARKATWLYCMGVELPPDLTWGPSPSRARLDGGFHSTEERRAARERGERPMHRTSGKVDNEATPIAFRDALLDIARQAMPALVAAHRCGR
jgi:hypothetical protein